MNNRNPVAILFLAFAVLLQPAQAQPYVIGYAETKSLVANMTMMSYDRAHGTQVEFLSANGKTHLLYPGNQVIVRGEWKLERTDNPKVFDMCFRYPTNSYNPATGQGGGKWECRAAGFYLAGIAEHATGDVLGLSRSKAAPFVLARRKTSLARLARQLSN